MRCVLICAAFLLLICPPLQVGAQQASDAVVNVTGEGSAVVVNGDIAGAADEAINAAKREAVEKGVGVCVKSETLGSDYQIVEQNILTKSDGFISSWSEIQGSRHVENVDGDELLTLKIDAKVKLINLVNALSDFEAIYASMQRPKVMVIITEKNMGSKCAELPASAAAIMRVLQERKFELVDPQVAMRAMEDKSTRRAIEKGDTPALASLAKSEGAEILVLGTASASEQSLPDDIGDTVKAAGALLNARIVYADTGEVLFTSGQIDGRGVSTSTALDAGVRALDNAGSKLIASDSDRFTSQVIARWAAEVQNGRTYKVIITGVTYSEFEALKKAISEFRGHVEFSGPKRYEGKSGTLYVKSTLAIERFRERLQEMRVNGKKVEIYAAAGTTTTLKPLETPTSKPKVDARSGK